MELFPHSLLDVLLKLRFDRDLEDVALELIVPLLLAVLLDRLRVVAERVPTTQGQVLATDALDVSLLPGHADLLDDVALELCTVAQLLLVETLPELHLPVDLHELEARRRPLAEMARQRRGPKGMLRHGAVFWQGAFVLPA